MNNDDVAERVDESAARIPLVKAHLISEGRGGDESRTIPQTERDKIFTDAGAVEPPYDPEMLALLFEHSNSLRQNVDAYARNIDGFGYTLVPIIDLDSHDANDQIKAALAVARGDDDDNDEEPTEQEIEDARKRIARGALRERVKLTAFFENCCDELSFVSLRQRTRQDIEILGNGYWEVLRTMRGDIGEFVYVPGYTVRLMPLDTEIVEVKQRIRRPDFEFEVITKRKRFRRFVQKVREHAVYFKEFGDPRLVSCRSGKTYATPEQMAEAEPGAKPATEMLHFSIHSPRSAYGVPRWVGNMLAVLGSRQAEEVNFLYFENKSVPPMAVLVSGGRLSASSIQRLQDFIETHIKGKRNFHRILILEAEPSIGNVQTETSARMKIEMRPLLGAQHNDALFQKYDERNLDKVGQAFRLPRMLRGDIRDFNRSTALAAKHFAEEQVFQPEREEFDWIINRRILTALGARFFRFRSLAPVTRDPQVMSESVQKLMNSGALVPEDGRELAGDIFNREFKRIDREWTKLPIQLTQSGYTEEGEGMPEGENEPEENEPEEGEGMEQPAAMRKIAIMARELIELREFLREAQRHIAVVEYKQALAKGDDEVEGELEREVIRVPEAEMRRLLGDDLDESEPAGTA
jgi:PBSX family phage portal protein